MINSRAAGKIKPATSAAPGAAGARVNLRLNAPCQWCVHKPKMIKSTAKLRRMQSSSMGALRSAQLCAYFQGGFVHQCTFVSTELPIYTYLVYNLTDFLFTVSFPTCPLLILASNFSKFTAASCHGMARCRGRTFGFILFLSYQLRFLALP